MSQFARTMNSVWLALRKAGFDALAVHARQRFGVDEDTLQDTIAHHMTIANFVAKNCPSGINSSVVDWTAPMADAPMKQQNGDTTRIASDMCADAEGGGSSGRNGDTDATVTSENNNSCTSEKSTTEDARELASLFPGEGGTPPEAVMVWIDKRGDFDEKLDGEKRHQRALAWLKAALPLAHKHSNVKDWVKRLLAVYKFTANMSYMRIFDPLQAFCRDRLLGVGQPLQAYYRDNDDVRGLADLYPDTLAGLASQDHLRQDDPLVGLSAPASFNMTTFEGESRYIHFLRLIALVLNEKYQTWSRRRRRRQAQRLQHQGRRAHAQQSPCPGRPSLLDKPRPAHNIDILRCCVTFPDAKSMRKGIESLVALAWKGVGGVGRVKNGFALSEEDAAKSFHYRSWMINMVVDFGQTFGEMFATPESADLMDKYVNAPPENPGEPWGRWRRDAQAALEALRSEEMSKRQAVMVCEVQVLLDPYLEARKEMHLLYKIVRAASAGHLLTQFAVQKKRSKDATWSSEEQRAVEEVTRGVEKRDEWAALLNACRDGFVKAVEIALKEDGVGVNQADKDGCTPLYMACQNGHVDVVRVLLSTDGVGVNQAREDGCTPLYIACQNGHVDVVRMLLSTDGVDVNLANANKQTPVNMASYNGHLEVVRLLLSRPGLDITTADKWGDAPEASACKKGHTEIVFLQERATSSHECD